MPTLKYKAILKPAKPTLTVSLSATADNLHCKVDSYALSLSLEPEDGAISNDGALQGSFLGALLTMGLAGINALSGGTIIKGIGNTAAEKINDAVKDNLTDKAVDIPIKAALSHTFDLAGVSMQLSPKELSLSAYDGYIMASGEMSIT